MPMFNYEFVKRSITISMDFKDRERELISKLLPQLCGEVLSRGDICKGFERLLEVIDDLQVYMSILCFFFLVERNLFSLSVLKQKYLKIYPTIFFSFFPC